MAMLAADPTGRQLGLQLPEGRIVPDPDGAPILWLSDAAVDAPTMTRLHTDVERTGLWPVALNHEGYTEPVQPDWPSAPFDADTVLAAWSTEYRPLTDYHDYDGCETCEAMIQVPRTFPGASFAAETDHDPGQAAAVVVADFLTEAPYLGLVTCEYSADIPTALGWSGPANRHHEIARFSAILRKWEDRYGARVVALFGASLVCSVARPPRTLDQALELAKEQLAFCPDLTGEFLSLNFHARSLIGTSSWSFWWD